MFTPSSKLQLNPAHPLCDPALDMRFCTFWTGGAYTPFSNSSGYFEDISPIATRSPGTVWNPAHGTFNQSYGSQPRIVRTLSTRMPGNIPSQMGCLAMRENVTGSAEYVVFQSSAGNVPSKITLLVDGFTVACWTRPYDLTSNYKIPIVCTDSSETTGWILFTALQPGPWTSYAVGCNSYGPSGINTYASDTVLNLGQWNLVVLVFSMSGYNYYGNRGVCFNINGSPVGRSYIPTVEAQNSASFFRVGVYTNPSSSTYIPNCDMGPIMIWNSMLTYEQIALLYRDTWGMVQPETPLAMKLQAYAVSSFFRSNGMMLTEVS